MKKVKTFLSNMILNLSKKRLIYLRPLKSPVFLVSLLLFTFSAQAAEINISSEKETLLISNKMSVFLDTTESLSIEEVSSEHELFIPNYADVINVQVTSSTVWVKFQLKNTTNLNELLLEIKTSNVDEVTLYKQTEGHFNSEGPYGQGFSYNTRFYNHPNILFTIDLRSGETATYYLRVRNQDQINLPIQVGSQKAVIEGIFDYDVSNGVYLGIFIIMFLYNLFLYFAIKNKYYIYYSIFVFTLGLGLFTISGYSFKYLWPESPWLETRAVVMISALIPITALIFANSFLNLKI